jgi:glutathione S-transferase
MIVHGARESVFVRKVQVVLREKEVAFEERRLVPVPKTAELLAKNPLGKIPILELADGTCIADSSVICLYLERKFPETRLYPIDDEEYARALFIEEYADTRLWDIAGGVMIEKYVKPNILGQPTDEARVHDLLTQQLPTVLDWLDRQLRPDARTLLERFSIADVAVGSVMTALTNVGERIDERRWPRVARYLDGLFARPSFVATAPGARDWPRREPSARAAWSLAIDFGGATRR